MTFSDMLRYRYIGSSPPFTIYLWAENGGRMTFACVTDFLNGSRSFIGRRFSGKFQGPQIVLQMLEIKRYATSVGKLPSVLVDSVLCSFHDPHPHSLPKGSRVQFLVVRN